MPHGNRRLPRPEVILSLNSKRILLPGVTNIINQTSEIALTDLSEFQISKSMEYFLHCHPSPPHHQTFGSAYALYKKKNGRRRSVRDTDKLR